MTVPQRVASGHPVPRMYVGDLRLSEAGDSAAIHGTVLSMEFLARFGRGFLTAYHRAWIRSPYGLALAARDPDGRVVGALLGSLDPALHYRWVLKHAGVGLAARLAGNAVLDPRLARDLVATRAARYTRALWRQLAPSSRLDRPELNPSRTGEIAHLMVASEGKRTGVGRALIDETERRARAEQVHDLALVTPPDLGASSFYRHLGWEPDGALTSRSGEAFIRFRRRL